MNTPDRLTGENKNERRNRAAAIIFASGVVANILAGCGIGGGEAGRNPAPQKMEWTSENVPEQIRIAGEAMTDYVCSVTSALDTQKPPTTGFEDDQKRDQFNVTVRMALPDDAPRVDSLRERPPLHDVRIGAIVHHNLDEPLKAHELEGSDDIIPGSFDDDAVSPVKMKRLSDGSMSIEGQVYPSFDQSKSDQRLDLFVFQKTAIDGWTLISAQPCGTVIGGKKNGNMLTAVRPLESDVAADWKAAK